MSTGPFISTVRLELQARSEEGAPRLDPEDLAAERVAARASDEILRADRRLVVRDVEQVHEKLRVQMISEALVVLRSQIDLAP